MFHAAVKPFTSRFCEILFPGHDQMMNPGAGRAPFQARLNTLSCPLHPGYKQSPSFPSTHGPDGSEIAV